MGAEQPSSLIPLADLVELDRIYFKLIPLKDDAKTPDASFLELYNDPDYWIELYMNTIILSSCKHVSNYNFPLCRNNSHQDFLSCL